MVMVSHSLNTSLIPRDVLLKHEGHIGYKEIMLLTSKPCGQYFLLETTSGC